MSFNYKIFKRLYLILALLLVVISAGTTGYVFIEGWKWFDAFYMTIITISTAGFQEVHPLSDLGRLFTSFLIVSCFGIFAYALSALTSYIVGGEYKSNLRDYRVEKKMRSMENHVVICGFGRVGKQVAADLTYFGEKFVVIENSEEVISDQESSGEYLFLKGDATNDVFLEKAKVSKAKALIACLPKDADNLYVILSSRQHNRSINLISRASSSSSVSKLKMGGANHVILPDSIGGSHMAALVSNPDVIEFMDAIKVQGHSGGVNIEAIAFNELPEEFQNKTIGQLEAKRITGVTIIGYKSPNGEYIINPDYDVKFVPNSQLFVLGSSEQIQKLNDYFSIKH